MEKQDESIFENKVMSFFDSNTEKNFRENILFLLVEVEFNEHIFRGIYRQQFPCFKPLNHIVASEIFRAENHF